MRFKSRIRFWNPIFNNGDAIISYLVKELTDTDPVFAAANQPHLLGVGSIFFMANSHSYVWGSGVLDPTASLPVFDPAKIRGLRGTLTRDIIKRAAPALRDVPLGDPGVLVSRLPECVAWRSSRNRGEGRRYRAAIIPHWTTFEFPIFTKYRSSSEIALVDMSDNSLAPLQKICQSDVVLSQSLHGLIYAEALGVPTLWLADKTSEQSAFKYRDWYTNVRNPPQDPVLLEKLTEAHFNAAEYREINVDYWAMISNFPRAEISYNSEIPVLDFEICRQSSPHFIICDQVFDKIQRAPGEIRPGDSSEAHAVLTNLLNNTYKFWAERPFSCIAASSWNVQPHLIEKIIDFMQRHHDIDIICLAKKNSVNQELCNSAPRFFYQGRDYFLDAGIIEQMIVVRPSASGLIGKKVATTFV